MRYLHVISGRFVARPNRFVARVETAAGEETVHVKNTGRCRELLIPGVTVYLARSSNPARKTAFDLVAVEKGDRLINLDAQAPNQVFAEWAASGGFLPEATALRREYVYGDSRLDFRLEGQAWRLGPATIDDTATLALHGPGRLTVPADPKQSFRGALRLEDGAEAHFEGICGGPPAVFLTRGATLTAPGNNLRLAQQFRLLDLAEGGTFRYQGKRLFLNQPADAPVRLGRGAVFAAHWVAFGGRFHAVAGDGALDGDGHVYGDLRLSAEAGATLSLRGRVMMYDYWKRGRILVTAENAGTVRLEPERLLPLCALVFQGGRTLLCADAAQDTEANWCTEKTCHDWVVRAGATLAGTGSATFSRDTRLIVEAGGILEGGEAGRGTLTLSRVALQAGAVLACRGGTVAVGALGAQGAVTVRLDGATPGTLLTWRTLAGATPTFLAEGLPAGRTLRVEGNSLTLT